MIMPSFNSRKSRLPRIALLIETSTTWGRHLVRGATKYAHEHGPWHCFLEPRGRGEKIRLPKGWSCDGIIARVNHPGLAEDIERLGVPAVNVSWYEYGPPVMARCTIDERAVGQIAANYLADRGFKNLAFYPAFDRPGYVDKLGPAFAQAAKKRNGLFFRYDSSPYDPARMNWETHLSDLAGWLSRLPKPLAVLAFGDFQGRIITEACMLADLRVPDEVAVLGSEQDDLSSAVSLPELSSVDSGGQQVGYLAAELLAGMIKGSPAPEKPIELEPAGVITRQSTDVLAVDHPDLTDCLRFILDNAHEPINVEDVLEHVALSRRKFELLFKETVGRSPAAAIRRVRLERAQRLLHDTTMPISEIARKCGFTEPVAMTRAFKNEFGVTPSQFPRQHVPSRRDYAWTKK